MAANASMLMSCPPQAAVTSVMLVERIASSEALLKMLTNCFLQDALSVSLTLRACLAIKLRSAEKRGHFLWRFLATHLVILLFCL